jgi:GxxExxY protein
MNTNSEKLLLKDEVFQVVGCAIEVLNTLGHGLVEKPYENALAIEFLLREIPFSSNLRLMYSTKVTRLASLFPTLSLSSRSSLIQR